MGGKKDKYFMFKLKQSYKDFTTWEQSNFDVSQQIIGHAAHYKCPDNCWLKDNRSLNRGARAGLLWPTPYACIHSSVDFVGRALMKFIYSTLTSSTDYSLRHAFWARNLSMNAEMRPRDVEYYGFCSDHKSASLHTFFFLWRCSPNSGFCLPPWNFPIIPSIINLR
jgi:hypothetical protein